MRFPIKFVIKTFSSMTCLFNMNLDLQWLVTPKLLVGLKMQIGPPLCFLHCDLSLISSMLEDLWIVLYLSIHLFFTVRFVLESKFYFVLTMYNFEALGASFF